MAGARHISLLLICYGYFSTHLTQTKFIYMVSPLQEKKELGIWEQISCYILWPADFGVIAIWPFRSISRVVGRCDTRPARILFPSTSWSLAGARVQLLSTNPYNIDHYLQYLLLSIYSAGESEILCSTLEENVLQRLGHSWQEIAAHCHSHY